MISFKPFVIRFDLLTYTTSLIRRIAVRKDTCRLDVLTLDVKERVSAFIWTKEFLPFDCLSALPVPTPVGGVLVFGVNSLHYLNQGVPPHAVSLNAVGDTTLENLNSKFRSAIPSENSDLISYVEGQGHCISRCIFFL